jgi:hypothetical protein
MGLCGPIFLEIESGKLKIESKYINRRERNTQRYAEELRGGTLLWKRGIGPARQNGVQARGELENRKWEIIIDLILSKVIIIQ